MKFPISIESTGGPAFNQQVFNGEKSISTGMTLGVPGGVDLTLQSMTENRAFDVPGVLEFVAETAVTLDVGLFGAWLYDKVKDQGRVKISISDVDLNTDDERFKEKLKAALVDLLESDEEKNDK